MKRRVFKSRRVFTFIGIALIALSLTLSSCGKKRHCEEIKTDYLNYAQDVATESSERLTTLERTGLLYGSTSERYTDLYESYMNWLQASNNRLNDYREEWDDCGCPGTLN